MSSSIYIYVYQSYLKSHRIRTLVGPGTCNVICNRQASKLLQLRVLGFRSDVDVGVGVLAKRDHRRRDRRCHDLLHDGWFYAHHRFNEVRQCNSRGFQFDRQSDRHRRQRRRQRCVHDSNCGCHSHLQSRSEHLLFCAKRETISDTTAGATIYYTTDGSTPTTASTKYVSAISVVSNLTVKAIATAPNFSPSAVASAAYRGAPQVAVVDSVTFTVNAAQPGTYKFTTCTVRERSVN